MKLSAMVWTNDLLRTHTIAQAADYDSSPDTVGCLVVRVENECGLIWYSHCSCYGTFDVVIDNHLGRQVEGTITWLWIGSYAALLDLAQRKIDPAIPGRVIQIDDHDYKLLIEVYTQVVERHKNASVPEQVEEDTTIHPERERALRRQRSITILDTSEKT